MIAEAVDTATAIGWAIVAWIAVGAAAVTVCLFTGILVGAWGWKTARRALARRCSASQGSDGAPDVRDAPEAVQGHAARPAPSWARDDHEEAA